MNTMSPVSFPFFGINRYNVVSQLSQVGYPPRACASCRPNGPAQQPILPTLNEEMIRRAYFSGCK
jgi:hypothetical protein